MTLLVVSLSSVNDILKVFLKVFHPRLQFTVKIEENQLNFLDVNIIKVNNSLEFNLYHKLTFSDRYLSFCLNILSFKKVAPLLSPDNRQSISSFTSKIPL